MKQLLYFLLFSWIINGFANEQSTFIEHQISQEIIINEEQSVAQLIWQNFTSVTQHFSELYANFHKKNKNLDINAKIQSFLELPEYKNLGALPTLWVESELNTDGSGEAVFGIPSHWHREASGIIDWNGLSGEMEFNHKFTTWKSNVNVNGLEINIFDDFVARLEPSELSAHYYLNPNAKPNLETKLNLPKFSYQSGAEILLLQYLYLSNNLLTEQYLPLKINSTLQNLCYQNLHSEFEAKILNMTELAVEFKARDTGMKFFLPQAYSSRLEDWQKFINIRALQPIEADIWLEKLYISDQGFECTAKGGDCKSVFTSQSACELIQNEIDANLKAKSNNFTFEAHNVKYNNRSTIYENELQLSNFYINLKDATLNRAGFSSQFEYLKFAILSELATSNTVKSSVNINLERLYIPKFLDEKLTTKLSLTVKKLDADALLKLQQLIEQVDKNLLNNQDAVLSSFALFDKYLEVIPKIIQKSPKIEISGLSDGEDFSILLGDENSELTNKLYGFITFAIDGSRLMHFFDQQALLSALSGDVKLNFTFTQNNIQKWISQLFDIDQQQAIQLIQQWVAKAEIKPNGESYNFTIKISLKDGELVGNNAASKLITDVLQPFLTNALIGGV